MQNLNTPDLSGLECQINSLLQNIHQLKLENNQLRNRFNQTKQELVELEEKNRHAAEKVNQLIAQLKEKMV